MSQNSNYYENSPLNCIYSRSNAIRDGILIDVTEQAKVTGFKYPVAVTQTVWGKWIYANSQLQEYGQSTEARLWDVLNVLIFKIRKLTKGTKISRIKFHVPFLMNAEDNEYEEAKLIAVCGPGDHGEPVLTIMVEEDE